MVMDQPSAPQIFQQLSNAVLIRFLLLFACGWAIVQVLAYFETVVVIFVSATLLAFLLSYPVRWLGQWLPHGWAVGCIFALALVLIAVATATIGFVVLAQEQKLAESTLNFLNSLVPLLGQFERYLHYRNLHINFEAVGRQFQSQALQQVTSNLSLVQIALTNLVSLLLTAVIAFLLLLDGKRLWHLTLKLVPFHRRERFSIAVRRNLQGFFWGQLLLCLFFISTAFIVFLLLQVPFPLALAVIVGVLDLIPGIGAMLGIGLVFLLLLSQGIWLALKALLACIVIQQIQENLLMPRIMQNSLNINPVLMFFALLIGARVAGIPGVFLAVPITGLIVNLFEIEEIRGRSPVQKRCKN
jgi:predicted PurR-regulated permease PerM